MDIAQIKRPIGDLVNARQHFQHRRHSADGSRRRIDMMIPDELYDCRKGAIVPRPGA